MHQLTLLHELFLRTRNVGNEDGSLPRKNEQFG
jgi:hypothetical protein